MARILVIDDNATMREGIAHTLRRQGHTLETASSGQAGLTLFKKRAADFVISDLKMQGLDGIGVLKGIRAIDPEALLMIVTGFGSVETAVEAMQLGAFDFITKPFSPALLRAKVASALERLKLRQQHEKLERHNEILREELEARYQPSAEHELVGDSSAMKRVLQTVARVAHADSTVHIYGESGTGKELVARALHRNSRRRKGPFIKVNCSALTETILESELFGHERGAFTSAHKRRLGRFELADGGTLFLDEIGEISPSIQLKLLRVIQEQAFERVGGEETIQVDVRLISATNKELLKEVEEKRFRQDLYYRLHIVPLILPPLRERPSDINALAEHFIVKLRDRTGSRVQKISPEAIKLMSVYPWPGNVRELENAIEQSLVFAEGERLEAHDLPDHIRGARGRSLSLPEDDRPLPEILESLEQQLIAKAFQEAGGVKTECARKLGIKTSALYYKLEKYGIS